MRNGKRSLALHNWAAIALTAKRRSRDHFGPKNWTICARNWLNNGVNRKNLQNFAKSLRLAVDDPARCVILVVPLDAGLHQTHKCGEVCSRNFWDCKLNSILSRFYRAVACERRRTEIGNRIEFFDARKLRSNRWFFEIYIQGSKYNFLELSLNLK
jgi:hypothetical protein